MADQGAPGLRAGRYQLFGRIAAGGMATVHFGLLRGDQGFSRVVAIKRMLPQLSGDPVFVTMFRDEAMVASRIKHPNVVPVLDVVAERAEAWLVMEYIRGVALSTLLQRTVERGERVPVPVAVAVVSGILSGLHAAHAARGPDGPSLGIVHRDVSPQNVLVDADGVARVVDFGIAKASSKLHITTEGELKGKVNYMAPEQFGGGQVDRRTDLFAVANVFWSMLAGRMLYGSEDPSQTVNNILRARPPSLRAQREDVSLELEKVIERGLAKQPDVRYPTAREFIEAIEAVISMPGTARSVGAWVERLAGDVLAKHDREVEGVERGEPASSTLAVEKTDGAVPLSADGTTTMSELPTQEIPSSLSLAPPEPGAQKGRGPRALVLFVAAGGAALLLLLVYASVTALRSAKSPAEVPSSGPTATEQAPAAAPPPIVATAEPSAVAVEVTPSSSSSAAAPASASAQAEQSVSASARPRAPSRGDNPSAVPGFIPARP
ncbi:MAG: serine/threonine protein kinase [Polyangiaceae bacterium]|nr:serine/threonine protein kinase [Polyangiaceae bacterium]